MSTHKRIVVALAVLMTAVALVFVAGTVWECLMWGFNPLFLLPGLLLALTVWIGLFFLARLLIRA